MRKVLEMIRKRPEKFFYFYEIRKHVLVVEN